MKNNFVNLDDVKIVGENEVLVIMSPKANETMVVVPSEKRAFGAYILVMKEGRDLDKIKSVLAKTKLTNCTFVTIPEETGEFLFQIETEEGSGKALCAKEYPKTPSLQELSFDNKTNKFGNEVVKGETEQLELKVCVVLVKEKQETEEKKQEQMEYMER